VIGSRRAAGLIVFVALAAYANALGNGFAYDDNLVILRNPVVTEARWAEALLGPYWWWAGEGSGLYRPVTLGAFIVQWRSFGGGALGFHVVNVLLHVMVTLGVWRLAGALAGSAAGLGAALWFAVQPIHVEAVANVVGFGELAATLAVLCACLIWLRSADWPPGGRAAGLGAIAMLYLVGLGAKEIAVSLPALLLLVELGRPGPASLGERLSRAGPMLLSLAAVLASYLVLRLSVLGSITGEVVAPPLRGLDPGQRVLTALTLWPEYLRLLVFPAVLSADYAPGVLDIARSPTAAVWVGALVLLLWGCAAIGLRRRAPTLALGLAWFLIAVLPVSNLPFAAGVLLAERTLYLPSVGGALVVAGLAGGFFAVPRPRRTVRLAAVLAALAGCALFVRTVTRNPTWWSTYTMLSTLAKEHPESYLALQHVGAGLARVGDNDGAARAYDAALELVPRSYALMVEAGAFYARSRVEDRAEELLRRAIAETPDQPTAYRLLAEQLIRLGRGREGHRVALHGLARAGPDRELWALVSEAYIAKGDLEASARARRAALAQDPTSGHDWRRLADVLDALGRTEEAAAARARATALERGGAA
jgi:tetratricopeptide (TPR) repeat protein